ncbi:uncharacterized protein EV154DRAFT_486977 [Mucor mucedo]|uniref:uncharacterized protein n=1 Tax=Mucor mucedo TaxID=29922 RepID=UPI00221EF03B|nr:uncharacterized protein EV154DRAFT_486977 [Mucor mucedo]KAI7874190.1 hypothetical protein EV154DRAFT_486977 [Mucor mucedo]
MSKLSGLQTDLHIFSPPLVTAIPETAFQGLTKYWCYFFGRFLLALVILGTNFLFRSLAFFNRNSISRGISTSTVESGSGSRVRVGMWLREASETSTIRGLTQFLISSSTGISMSRSVSTGMVRVGLLGTLIVGIATILVLTQYCNMNIASIRVIVGWTMGSVLKR